MSNTAILIAIGGGLLIPLLNALAVKPSAPAVLKSVVALILAGVTAVVSWAASVGVDSWKEALAVFATALVAAGGTRVAVTGGLDSAIAHKTPNVGIGSTPEYPTHP